MYHKHWLCLDISALIILVLLVLSAAFDKANHDVLLLHLAASEIADSGLSFIHL